MRGAIATSIAFLLALSGGGLDLESARAEPGPVRLVSTSAAEPADFAETPALSGDGRYVAFRGSIGGRIGIFRKDLDSGEIASVATASIEALPQPDAAEPSISDDGRYVSFTTTAPLEPAADGAGSSDSDVYVADMSTPSSPSYELASALDGCDQAASATPCGLTYGGPAGSLASGRSSLSGDGRRIVFVTRASSNLTGDPTKTPAGQVVLRDLESSTTTLVSVKRDPLGEAMEPGVPVPGGATMSGSLIAPGAALSADGTTVAWLGTNLSAQVPLLADETLAASEGYDEPLWRRVADGPTAPTRRIVGGFSGIATGANTVHTSECSAPPVSGWDLARVSADFVPRLSRDGRDVALLGQPNGFTNVFFVDMSEGSARSGAVRQLTRELPVFEENACLAGQNEFLATAGDISGAAISPDGSRVAFTTQRQQFPLTPPNLIGGPPAGMGLAELYLVDLGSETLQRLTHGATLSEPSKRLEEGKGNSAPGASAVSFEANGETLAFSSRASNLVAGDGNGGLSPSGQGSDVFVVSDPRFSPRPGLTTITARPPPLRLRLRRRLSASAHSRPDGSVRLVVLPPGAGRLRASAEAELGPNEVRRRVADATRRARDDSVLTLSLEPARRYRGLVHSQAGLEATLELRFTGMPGGPLTQRLDVLFRQRGPRGPKASTEGVR